jgi:hypothetical protein
MNSNFQMGLSLGGPLGAPGESKVVLPSSIVVPSAVNDGLPPRHLQVDHFLNRS